MLVRLCVCVCMCIKVIVLIETCMYAVSMYVCMLVTAYRRFNLYHEDLTICMHVCIEGQS